MAQAICFYLFHFVYIFFIEFCQLFLARGTDIDDLLLNIFGAFLGVLIYTFLQKAFPKVVASFRLK
ncbi:MAG: VanZ family protein [Clostridia bacterium]|nr:VanZ family protein [Clostridia bacterium]